jgi:hypothetical protein
MGKFVVLLPRIARDHGLRLLVKVEKYLSAAIAAPKR